MTLEDIGGRTLIVLFKTDAQPAVPQTNVFEDGMRDVMTGSAGRDWFFANLDEGVKDFITDLNASEFANDLDFINSEA